MHRRRSASLHCTLMGHNAATTTSRHNAATTTSPTMHATPRSHPVQQAHGLALLERGQRPGGVGQVLRAEVGQQAQRLAHQRLHVGVGGGGEGESELAEKMQALELPVTAAAPAHL